MSEDRELSVIFAEVLTDWPKAQSENHPAGAYAVPLCGLSTLDDVYGVASAKSLVQYFLANAGSWRGETARRVKAELRAMVGQ